MPRVTIFVPIQLREITKGAKTIEINARTVASVILEADKQYPGFKAEVFCEPGHKIGIQTIALNGKYFSGLSKGQVVSDGDRISLFPYIQIGGG